MKFAEISLLQGKKINFEIGHFLLCKLFYSHKFPKNGSFKSIHLYCANICSNVCIAIFFFNFEHGLYVFV